MKLELSETEEYMLEWVTDTINNNGRDYAYCECDEHDCKPWRSKTVFSLIKKGLIELVEGADMIEDLDGIYFLTLGHKLKQIEREENLKIILD